MLKIGIATAALLGTAALQAEEILRLGGTEGEPVLLVRREPGPGAPVLLVHGATFPSGLSFAYRIDGRSWMDDLRKRGFDVWAFDFAGYGGSDRPKAMDVAGSKIGDTPDAARQIARVAGYVLRTSGKAKLSIIAHSWGTLPAGLFASREPQRVERLVLFGPVARRESASPPVPPISGSTLSTSRSQRASFDDGVPAGEPAPFPPTTFEGWMRDYLASDPDAMGRTPPAVRVPAGPQHDIAQAWSGGFPYDPAAIRTPTLILRGAWDTVSTAADIGWLKRALTGVPGGTRDLTLPRGTHRMHLEANRQALFDAVAAYLAARASRPH